MRRPAAESRPSPPEITRELPGGRRHGSLQRYATTSSASRPRRAHVRRSDGIGRARRHGRRDDAEGNGDCRVWRPSRRRHAHARVYASRAGRMYTFVFSTVTTTYAGHLDRAHSSRSARARPSQCPPRVRRARLHSRPVGVPKRPGIGRNSAKWPLLEVRFVSLLFPNALSSHGPLITKI